MLTLLGLLVAVQATTSPIAPETPHKPLGGAECAPVAKEAIYHKIEAYAREYAVSEAMMTYVVFNEADKTLKGDLLPCGIGDTHLIDPDGNPHISRGIVQINEYWNPDVTPGQAFDVEFSLAFLADGLSKGYCSRWTTCRAYMDSLSVK